MNTQKDWIIHQSRMKLKTKMSLLRMNRLYLYCALTMMKTVNQRSGNGRNASLAQPTLTSN